jgi:hypothetical protein
MGVDHPLADRVIAPISLAPRFVADEDRLQAAIIQFLEVEARDLDMDDAPKCVQVVHDRCISMLHLVQTLPVDGARQGTVEDVHGRRDRLTPELSWQFLGLDHAVCHLKDALVSLLHHPVLLG